MLSLGRFALGLTELVAVGGAAWFGAAAVRARCMPAWRGLAARLADTIIALGLIVVVEQLLGTFGLLREWIVVAAIVATGVGLRLVLGVPAKQIRIARTTRTDWWWRASSAGAVV